jgi:PAS domain S-box-containing protein
MNLDFLLKYVFASFLLITLLSVAFFSDSDRQKQYFENNLLVSTKQIRLLNLQLNQAVLKMQFGLNNETEISHYLLQLNAEYQELSSNISTEKSLYDDEMNLQLAALYSEIYQKRQTIENFKKTHAELKQHRDQFEKHASEIIKENNNDLAIKNYVYQLQKSVFQHFLEPAIIIPIIENQQSIFSNENNNQQQLNSLFQETKTILSDQEKIDSASAHIINTKQITIVDSLEKYITYYFDNRHQKKSTIQSILFAIAILSIIYVLYLLASLRKKSTLLEKLLIDTEKQQIALNEHAIVSAADTKGNITYVNKKFCDISGYTAEELLGQNHRILKSGYHPSAIYNDMWRTISEGKVWHGELKNKKKDGGFYWVNGTIVPFLNKQGKPTQYISIRTDITRQKELEKQLLDGQHFLKQVTGAMAQGLYALNKKGLCTFWNREAEHILGWTEQELLNKNIHEIIHFQDENGLRIKKENCLPHNKIENNKAFSSDTEFFTHKDGRILPISIIAVPLLEKNKKIGTVAVFSDISKRKADEKIINQAIINAQQANQAKSDFLANMSHEIRTPMNGIIGMTELTLETELTDEQREYIEIVKDSSYALLDIVNDILDFSKIESGRLVLEHIEFDINQLLNRTLAMLTPKATQKNVSLAIDNCMNKNANLQLIGDPGRLRQVIINLVGNAIKFTLHGSIQIKVSIQEKTTDKCCLLFSISDTGIGIPEDKRDSIFDAFSQADTSVTRRFGGTGLGLSISKQFIELMNGKIWLESAVNQGTTFFFTCWFDYTTHTIDSNRLAVTEKNNVSNQTASPLNSTMTSSASKKQLKLNILLAEDNLINQKLAKKLLEKQGHQVEIANNGVEAVALFESKAFDLILMDFQMPEMNGLEAASKIREVEEHTGGRIPIIAMTANAMKEDKERALNAGMDAYIPKPINVPNLLSEISRFFPETAHEKNEVDYSDLCNWDAALARLGGESEILEMLVKLFLEEQSSYIEKIHQAINEQNSDVLERELHTLKGICATIGAEKIERIIKSLEIFIDNKNFATFATAFAEVERELSRLIIILRKKVP